MAARRRTPPLSAISSPPKSAPNWAPPSPPSSPRSIFRMSSTPETITTAIPEKPLHKNEQLKEQSKWLRGTILSDLANPTTGAVTEDSTQLMKFHGVYQQDDRDVRNQRRK